MTKIKLMKLTNVNKYYNDYRLSIGNEIAGMNARLHRRVMRRVFAHDATTFVQYRFIQQ